VGLKYGESAEQENNSSASMEASEQKRWSKDGHKVLMNPHLLVFAPAYRT
jgi:hypothetical protein